MIMQVVQAEGDVDVLPEAAKVTIARSDLRIRVVLLMVLALGGVPRRAGRHADREDVPGLGRAAERREQHRRQEGFDSRKRAGIETGEEVALGVRYEVF